MGPTGQAGGNLLVPIERARDNSDKVLEDEEEDALWFQLRQGAGGREGLGERLRSRVELL